LDVFRSDALAPPIGFSADESSALFACPGRSGKFGLWHVAVGPCSAV